MSKDFHDYKSFDDEVVGSSNRSFGFVFSAFFLIIAIVQFYAGAHGPACLFGGLSALFLVISLLFPKVLAPLNWLWTRLGLLMYKVVNPLIFGLLFVLMFTPTGLYFRIVRHDVLRRTLSKDVQSYWIARDEPGPSRSTMTQQF